MTWTKTPILALTTAFLWTSTVPSFAEDWDQWRGPRRDGTLLEASWTDSLDDLRPLWSVDLGKGYPGPLVVGDSVVVVETVDEATAGVRRLALEDGSEIWSREWPSAGSVPFFAKRNGDWVRSTPITDGERLFVGDMQEVLRAFDLEDGRLLWSVDFPARFETGVPEFGFASSPLIDGDRLIVQAANSVVALDRATGEALWRALPSEGEIQDSGAFSSPVLADLAGRSQLVVQARHTLHGLDPESGSVLWSRGIENFRGMMILTPTVVGGRGIFTSTYKGRSHYFEIVPSGDGFDVVEQWTNKSAGYMSSPVVVDGRAFLHLGNGRVDCIDLATGESLWRSSESFGDYWSLIRHEDRLLVLDEQGELLLVEPSPEELRVLDRREVASEAWAHLAARADVVVVRGLESVTAYRWQADVEDSPEAVASR